MIKLRESRILICPKKSILKVKNLWMTNLIWTTLMSNLSKIGKTQCIACCKNRLICLIRVPQNWWMTIKTMRSFTKCHLAKLCSQRTKISWTKEKWKPLLKILNSMMAILCKTRKRLLDLRSSLASNLLLAILRKDKGCLSMRISSTWKTRRSLQRERLDTLKEEHKSRSKRGLRAPSHPKMTIRLALASSRHALLPSRTAWALRIWMMIIQTSWKGQKDKMSCRTIKLDLRLTRLKKRLSLTAIF